MKKIATLFCLLLTYNVYADQLIYLTKDQAEKTVKFLKENSVDEAILWCACCTNEPMEKISISNYYYRYTGYEQYYEVVFEGTLNTGKSFKNPVDLAYVFLRSGRMAKCLGKLLNFKCDPCTLPFDWVLNGREEPKNKPFENEHSLESVNALLEIKDRLSKGSQSIHLV
jgi:hypothetical protein